MIRCVVFDLDGTLVDIGDLFYRVFADVVAAHGLEPVPFDRHGDPWVSAHAQTIDRYPELLNVAAEPSFADIWERVLRQMLAEGEVKLCPGALAALEGMCEAGQKMCLATNTPRRFVEIKLDALKIGGFFATVFTPQDPWGPKPKPDSLFHLMEIFQLAPAEILMVGDHAQDIMYGKSAGVRTVGLLNGYGMAEELRSAEPDFVLTHVSEITGLVHSTSGPTTSERHTPFLTKGDQSDESS